MNKEGNTKKKADKFNVCSLTSITLLCEVKLVVLSPVSCGFIEKGISTMIYDTRWLMIILRKGETPRE